ncbi:MAG: biotin--[acetyl-CoA-carboxylase] ligase, partial [Sphingomonadales bacterium]|nr:biotin--[acetyl-CoA-carboxylase] ligase [Sphingomonadales bacterium]
AAKNANLLDIQFIQSVGDGHVFFTPSCDSTQSEIQRFIEHGAMGLSVYETPIALFTHFQSQGVGQRGNEWLSESAANLLMTVAFPLQKDRDYAFVEINKGLSVSIAKTLGEIIEQKVEIKWPNDIIYKHLKLGGILLETTQIGQVKYLLMGLGINVNQRRFPDHLLATSLWLAKQNRRRGEAVDLPANEGYRLEDLASSLFQRLLEAWKNPNEFAALYLDCLYRKGDCVSLTEVKTDSVFQAKVVDVNSVGQLVVQLESGEIVAFHHGDVRLLYQTTSKI